MVAVAGQEDVVANELAALQGNQGEPFAGGGFVSVHAFGGLPQFYLCASSQKGDMAVRTDTPRSDIRHHGACPALRRQPVLGGQSAS